MKKEVKVILTVLLAAMLVFAVAMPVFAEFKPGDTINGVTSNASNNTDVAEMGGKIVGIIQTVGTVIAVVMLLVIGIKYMIGSAEEKAKYKETLLPYVIGAVLIFAASTLVGVIYNASTNITKTNP
jgi:type IV secretory pathway VirB2 component (pilin)